MHARQVREMLDYAQSQNVSLLAYVYPVLPFTGEGAAPRNGRNGDGWLYDGQRDPYGGYQPLSNVPRAGLSRAGSSHPPSETVISV